MRDYLYGAENGWRSDRDILSLGKATMVEYTEQDKYWIWMASMPEVTPKAFYYILKQFGCAAAFYDAVSSGSSMLESVPQRIRDAAYAACSKQYLAETICLLNTKGIHAVTRLGDDYPTLLKEISFPPPVLYVKGSLEALGETISIVGTRGCSRHGYDIATEIAATLVENGVTVISGMARGIDTAAHKGALKAGGKTVAVLGCGVDVVYPQGNEALYHEIISSGAVVSELIAGTQPLAAYFPARNRIVTGMSRGTLIVESESKGGTAISANLAIAQKRDVFAVPGMGRLAQLPNELIKQGAVPVTCARDILEYYGRKAAKLPGNYETSNEQIKNQLDFLQSHIYNLLLKGDISVENIAAGAQAPQSEINAALTMMEISGLIKRLPGGKYGI